MFLEIKFLDVKDFNIMAKVIEFVNKYKMYLIGGAVLLLVFRDKIFGRRGRRRRF